MWAIPWIRQADFIKTDWCGGRKCVFIFPSRNKINPPPSPHVSLSPTFLEEKIPFSVSYLYNTIIWLPKAVWRLSRKQYVLHFSKRKRTMALRHDLFTIQRVVQYHIYPLLWLASTTPSFYLQFPNFRLWHWIRFSTWTSLMSIPSPSLDLLIQSSLWFVSHFIVSRNGVMKFCIETQVHVDCQFCVICFENPLER